jgi:hypothetical protein
MALASSIIPLVFLILHGRSVFAGEEKSAHNQSACIETRNASEAVDAADQAGMIAIFWKGLPRFIQSA